MTGDRILGDPILELIGEALGVFVLETSSIGVLIGFKVLEGLPTLMLLFGGFKCISL